MQVLKHGFENEIIQEVEDDKESEIGDISSEVRELFARTFKLGEKKAEMPKRPRGREGPALPPRPKRSVERAKSARSHESQYSLSQQLQD